MSELAPFLLGLVVVGGWFVVTLSGIREGVT
jgi:hypothetical protein